MNNYLIDFHKMKWESPVPGLRQKIRALGNLKMRLAEYSEDFGEPDWCHKGHIGFIIEGNVTIDFDGKVSSFKAGDGLYVPGGESSRHKAKIAKGETALILFLEKAV